MFNLRQAIEKAGYEVVWVPYHMGRLKEQALRVGHKLLFGLEATHVHTRLYNKGMATSIDKSIVNNCDILFFPGAAAIGYFLKTDKPIVYLSDATYKIMLDYYWHNIRSWAVKEGNMIEQLGVSTAKVNIRASQWAADSTINDYHASPDHTYVLEFGANIDDKDILRSLTYGGGKLRILFSGVDWHRKGASIAIETVDILNERGIDTELLMAGLKSIPPEYENHPHVTNLGFLNKNNPEQYKLYVDTIRQSHLLLLPTKAECAGIVFSEAAAYGLPTYTYLTGGTGNYVIDGVNGYALPLTATAKDFADAIECSLGAEQQQKLQEGALKMYRERLSWDAWARRFREIIEKEFPE